MSCTITQIRRELLRLYADRPDDPMRRRWLALQALPCDERLVIEEIIRDLVNTFPGLGAGQSLELVARIGERAILLEDSRHDH